MSGTQQLVGAAGLGLIVANALQGQQHTELAALWSGSGSLTAPQSAARQIGAEALGVGVLVLIAGTGPTAGASALAVIGALWLVWLMTHHGATRATGSTPFPTGPTHGPTAA